MTTHATLTHEDLRRAEELRDAYRRIIAELARFIVGQEEVIEQLVIAILARPLFARGRAGAR